MFEPSFRAGLSWAFLSQLLMWWSMVVSAWRRSLGAAGWLAPDLVDEKSVFGLLAACWDQVFPQNWWMKCLCHAAQMVNHRCRRVHVFGNNVQTVGCAGNAPHRRRAASHDLSDPGHHMDNPSPGV